VLRRNIEIKCRCADLAAARLRAQELGARDAGVLHQHDTFFEAPSGRLKLRDFGDGRAELISYRRPDTAEAHGSDFFVYPVADPALLRATLAHALVTGGTVRKRRHLFLYRHTRIHLDEVDGLGTFVELETVMSDQSEREGRAELAHVADALALKPEDAVPQPYVELLLNPLA
jgi:adenylate cyclase class IV